MLLSLEPLLLTLGEGCVSRAGFRAFSEGARIETSLCWLSMSIMSVCSQTKGQLMNFRVRDLILIVGKEGRLSGSRQREAHLLFKTEAEALPRARCFVHWVRNQFLRQRSM